MSTTTPRTPRIDVHPHMRERTASAAGIAHSVVTGFGARSLPPAAPGTAQGMADLSSYDAAMHVEMLDGLQLDAEIVSSMTVRQGTARAASELAHDLNRRIDDEIALWVKMQPTRIIGSFTLPLQARDRCPFLTCVSGGLGVAPAPGSSATPWAPDGR
jgi:hypothetical protein